MSTLKNRSYFLNQIRRIIEEMRSTEGMAGIAGLWAALAALTSTVNTKVDNSALADYVLTTTFNAALAGYATIASLASYVTNSSLASILTSYTTLSALAATLAGYVTTSALTAALTNKVEAYGNTGVVIAGARLLVKNFTLTVAGTATIYLTDNGLSTGNPLFPTAIFGVQPVINDATTFWPVSRSISADRKTMTLTVNKSAVPLLSLLGLNILAAPTAAPIGTTVELLIIGY